MKKLLTLLFLVITFYASAQYSPTGTKTRYVNGIGIGTKLDAYFTSADSLALYARADSSLMFKYKGTARALAYAVSGGYLPISDTAAMLYDYTKGNGLSGYIPKWTASNILDTSLIKEVGATITIGNSAKFSNDSTYNGQGTASSGGQYLHIGSNAWSGDNTGIGLSRNLVGNGLFSHGFRDESTFNTSGKGAYCSYDAIPYVWGTDSLNHIAGFQDRGIYRNTNSINTWEGFVSYPTFDSGQVYERTAIDIFDPAGSGSVLRNVGIRIMPMSRGSLYNYAIETQGTTPSLFGGTITGHTINLSDTLFATAVYGKWIGLNITSDKIAGTIYAQPNLIPKYDGSGFLHTGYIIMNGPGIASTTPTSILTEYGDSVIRRSNPTAIANFLGLGSMAYASTGSYLPLTGGTLSGTLNGTNHINSGYTQSNFNLVSGSLGSFPSVSGGLYSYYSGGGVLTAYSDAGTTAAPIDLFSGGTRVFRADVSGAAIIGGATNVASAQLNVISTTKGSIPFPVMTETQRAAISSPAAGLNVFVSTTYKPKWFDGSVWRTYLDSATAASTYGSGTVTSITINNASGLTGSTPITTTGTIGLDTTIASTKANVTAKLIGYAPLASPTFTGTVNAANQTNTGYIQSNFWVAKGGLGSFTSSTGAMYGYYSSGSVITSYSDAGTTAAALDLFSGPTRVLRIATTGNALFGGTAAHNGAPKLDVTGKGYFSDTLQTTSVNKSVTEITSHIIGNSSTPTISVNGVSGTSASITGTDLAGEITFTTSNSSIASGTILTVTFNTAFTAAPYVVFSPSNDKAPNASPYIYVTNRSTTVFDLAFNASYIQAGTTYKWTYQVIQ